MLRIILSLISNAVAIIATEYLVVGFEATDDYVSFAIVVILFAIANSFLLPMLRFIFKPLSWLTLGIFPVLLNGLMIYAVDFFSDGITISGLMPLLWATLIIGMINATFAHGAKAFKN